MTDSGKLSTVESLQGIDSGPEILSYDRRKTEVAFAQDIPNEQASHQKFQTHLSEAPDGGIRAWLAVFAQVQVYLVQIVIDDLGLQYRIGYILYVSCSYSLP
jgi:hypothetical protein